MAGNPSLSHPLIDSFKQKSFPTWAARSVLAEALGLVLAQALESGATSSTRGLGRRRISDGPCGGGPRSRLD